MWMIFALLSAIFAALTSILAKIGIELKSCDGNKDYSGRRYGLGHSFPDTHRSGLPEIGKKSRLFLILSGLATGASWLCYYKALQMGKHQR